MFNNRNPVLSEETFERQAQANSGLAVAPMTLNGTIRNTGIMLVLVLAGATVGWNMPIYPLAIALIFLCIGLAIFSAFRPQVSPITAPFYGIGEGYLVGVMSLLAAQQLANHSNPLYRHAVPVAAVATFATLGVMLTLWVTRVLRMNDTLRSVLIGSTIAIGVFYLGTFLLSFAFPKIYSALPVFGNGPIGIGFSIFVIALAAFNFLLDFELIENGVRHRAPKYMEWYGALAITITIVWLYIEILRLIRKLGSR